MTAPMAVKMVLGVAALAYFGLPAMDAIPVIVAPDPIWPKEDHTYPAPSIDDKIFRLFNSLCLGGKVGEAGLVAPMRNQEKSFVYCRQPGFTAGSDPAKPQVIFVEPPGVDQRHNVIVNAIKAPPGEGPHTRVYVTPPKVSNQYNVDVSHHPSPGEKPAVFFLKGEDAPVPPPHLTSAEHRPPPKIVSDILENLPTSGQIPWGE